MAYVPDATNLTQPADAGVLAKTAAAEFRTLKTYISAVVLASIADALSKSAGGTVVGNTIFNPGPLTVGNIAALAIASQGTNAYVYNAANTGTVASNALIRAKSVNRNANVQLVSVATGTASYSWLDQSDLFKGDMGFDYASGDIFWRTATTPGTGIERMRLTLVGELLIASIVSAGATAKLQVGDGAADTRSIFNPNNSYAIGVRNGSGASAPYYIGATSGATPSLVFSNQAGTQRASLTDAGLFTAVSLAVGNAAVAGATILDWYEENTFTATPRADSVPGTWTPTTARASYTRVGNRVKGSIFLNGSITVWTGVFEINLPFNVAAAVNAAECIGTGMIRLSSSGPTTWTNILVTKSSNAGFLNIRNAGGTSLTGPAINSVIGGASENVGVSIHFDYECA